MEGPSCRIVSAEEGRERLERLHREASFRVCFGLPAAARGEPLRELQVALRGDVLNTPALRRVALLFRGPREAGDMTVEVFLPAGVGEAEAREVAAWLERQPLPTHVRVEPGGGAATEPAPPAT